MIKWEPEFTLVWCYFITSRFRKSRALDDNVKCFIEVNVVATHIRWNCEPNDWAKTLDKDLVRKTQIQLLKAASRLPLSLPDKSV